MKTLPSKFVPKGWGYERWIANNDLYCGKELFIAKSKKFSVHWHEKKDETFYVAKGIAVVRFKQLPEKEEPWSDMDYHRWWMDSQVQTLEPGDVFHVPVKMIHQVEAMSDFTMFEFSTHHDDDDSYRIIRGD